MKYLRSSVRRASCRANPVRVKAVVTQRADRTFAPEGAGHASRALILQSAVVSGGRLLHICSLAHWRTISACFVRRSISGETEALQKQDTSFLLAPSRSGLASQWRDQCRVLPRQFTQLRRARPLAEGAGIVAIGPDQSSRAAQARTQADVQGHGQQGHPSVLGDACRGAELEQIDRAGVRESTPHLDQQPAYPAHSPRCRFTASRPALVPIPSDYKKCWRHY
jgi:hypothetical protein